MRLDYMFSHAQGKKKLTEAVVWGYSVKKGVLKNFGKFYSLILQLY